MMYSHFNTMKRYHGLTGGIDRNAFSMYHLSQQLLAFILATEEPDDGFSDTLV